MDQPKLIDDDGCDLDLRGPHPVFFDLDIRALLSDTSDGITQAQALKLRAYLQESYGQIAALMQANDVLTTKLKHAENDKRDLEEKLTQSRYAVDRIAYAVGSVVNQVTATQAVVDREKERFGTPKAGV